ncbi:DUF1349 domain-containing protein [Pelomyxa schiedti]|nr:DUF1349 domain-containing protein [Pelomyxa schiedti]
MATTTPPSSALTATASPLPPGSTTSARGVIEEVVRQVEAHYGVAVVAAVEGGSRAWGFASPKSDHDVRGVFVRRRDEYLRIEDEALPDTISYKADTCKPQVEFVGWDIRKALKLLRESNPGILEWFSLPRELVYRDLHDFFGATSSLAQRDMSPEALVRHYRNTAMKHQKLYFTNTRQVMSKKYFYVFRPLLCVEWIINNPGKPSPVSLHDLVALSTAEAAHTLSDMLTRHNSQGSGLIDRVPLLDQWAQDLFAKTKTFIDTLPAHRPATHSGVEYNTLCSKMINTVEETRKS